MATPNRKKQSDKSPEPRNDSFAKSIFALLFQLTDPQSVPWIASVLIVWSQGNSAKEIILELAQSHNWFVYLIFVLIIILLLIALIAVSFVWIYTRKLDRIEMKRIAGERDELQTKLDCRIQSSENQEVQK